MPSRIKLAGPTGRALVGARIAPNPLASIRGAIFAPPNAGLDAMDQDSLMERAAALALQKMRANQGGPFGALIVRDGEVIAEGWNQVTSANDPTGHAEVTAIRNACAQLKTFSLEGCDIYTNCEPCPMCLGAIYWARLHRIYYSNTRNDAAKIGFDDDFIYREIGMSLEERRIPAIRVANTTAELAFSEWASKPDKQRY